MVVAQVRVPADTTEVTQIKALLEHVEVAGMVVTADAAHPSSGTAVYLHGRGADYVFTVKGNRPGAAGRDHQPALGGDSGYQRPHRHRTP